MDSNTKKKTLLKTILRTVGNGVNKTASVVANAVGGKDLVDFAGAKIAKAMVPDKTKPFVTDKVSGRKALKSAGKVGLTLGALALTPSAGSATMQAITKHPTVNEAVQGSNLRPGSYQDDITSKLVDKYQKKILQAKQKQNGRK